MRRRVVLGGLGAVVAAAGTIGLAGHAALAAADDLERAQERLRVVQQPGTSTEAAVLALRMADEDVDRAQESLGGWPVDAAASLPVLGRSWQAERAVARTARELIAGAVVLADSLPSVRATAGGVDLVAIEDLRQALAGPAARSQDALQELEAVPLGLTPPQVSRGVADARTALTPAVGTLQEAEQGLDVVAGLLGRDGPRHLLVMLQNNAELRGAGGYAASYATGRLQDGRLVLDPLRDVVAVADEPEDARRVPAPEEYVEDYGALAANTTMWRSWNMSPHVPDSALVGARVAGALLGQEPDVVVLLDVPAMGALAGLGGSGIPLPDGSSVSPQELTDALLVDAYARAGDDTEAQVRRRADLQAAATSAVTRLLSGGVPAPEAARTMGRLAAQRHVAVWSARTGEQAALTRLGMAGDVAPPAGSDLMHVSVNNIGGNKLDYYVRRELGVDVEVGERSATVVHRVRLHNAAPAGLVPYVAGYDRPGLLLSRVELSLPPQATVVAATVDGRPWPGPRHDGGLRQRLVTRLEVPRGAQALLEVRYTVPVTDGRYRTRLIPQPLVADADLRLTVRAAKGQHLGALDGEPVLGDTAEQSGPLSEVRDVSVELRRDRLSRWERFAQWWNSPVELG